MIMALLLLLLHTRSVSLPVPINVGLLWDDLIELWISSQTFHASVKPRVTITVLHIMTVSVIWPTKYDRKGCIIDIIWHVYVLFIAGRVYFSLWGCDLQTLTGLSHMSVSVIWPTKYNQYEHQPLAQAESQATLAAGLSRAETCQFTRLQPSLASLWKGFV